MITLKHVKDAVARKHRYDDFMDMRDRLHRMDNVIIEQIARRYAKAVAEAALQRAVDRSEIPYIAKQAILATPIELP